MYKDPIIEEVRKNREELFKMFDYDLGKFTKYIIEKQNENKDRLITKPFKKEVIDTKLIEC